MVSDTSTLSVSTGSTLAEVCHTGAVFSRHGETYQNLTRGGRCFCLACERDSACGRSTSPSEGGIMVAVPYLMLLGSSDRYGAVSCPSAV